MGYVDQGCRNITLRKENDHLWLSAECPRNNGTFRTSQIDLNLCIGHESGVRNGGLEALHGWKSVLLTQEDTGSHGNHNGHRNWELIDGGRKFKCDKEVAPGIESILPWNWFSDNVEWSTKEFNLNDHLNVVDGVLEFWAKKYESDFPEWVHSTLEFAGKVAEEAEDWDKPPLARAIDAYTESMLEEKLKSLGWEEEAAKWLKGTVIKGDRICRLGS